MHEEINGAETIRVVQTNTDRRCLCVNGLSPREVLTDSHRSLVEQNVSISWQLVRREMSKYDGFCNELVKAQRPEVRGQIHHNWGGDFQDVRSEKGTFVRKVARGVGWGFLFVWELRRLRGFAHVTSDGWSWLQAVGGTKLMEQNSWKKTTVERRIGLRLYFKNQQQRLHLFHMLISEQVHSAALISHHRLLNKTFIQKYTCFIISTPHTRLNTQNQLLVLIQAPVIYSYFTLF